MHESFSNSVRAKVQNFARAATLKFADFGVEHVKSTQFFAFVNLFNRIKLRRKKMSPKKFP